MNDLQTLIDAAWEDRNSIGADTSGYVRSAVEQAIAALKTPVQVAQRSLGRGPRPAE